MGTSAEARFFGVLHRSAPWMSTAWWLLVLVRGALPALFAVAMGVLVGAVQRGDDLAAPLAALGVLFVAMQALGPVHDALSSNLGSIASESLHVTLLEACTSPEGLAHLENPDLADELSAARDFELGITGPNITICMPNIGGGLAALMGGAAQALLLAGFRWWAPLVVGGGWLATHKLLADAAIWRHRADAGVMETQRRADYAYRLAVHPPGSKEMRLFGLARWVVDGFAAIRHELLDLSWTERRLRWRSVRTAIAVVLAANLLFFWALASTARGGALAPGEVVVYAQAAIGAAALAFGEFDWWLRTAAQPVPLVLDLVDRMRAAGALSSGDRAATGMPERSIRFEGVTFAYPSTGIAVLEDFDLEIPAGSSLAIVGQNGAGKTTLAKLLCRMYDPAKGRITVDGIDLRDLDIASWRSRLAAVFQDFVRYELALRGNVAPAGAPDAAVQAALDAARAGSRLSLDVVLSRAYEGGTDLSGGQWQRVALARALCAVQLGAGVVILDEPTAQLDVRGEAEIFESLLAATAGCTTILISHRFSTVRRADRICVVENGAVVELGTHDELMARGGRYRAMFDLQAARFGEAAADEGETSVALESLATVDPEGGG